MDALRLLQDALPSLQFVELPDYGVQYRWNNMAMNLAMQAPKMFRAIAEEQKVLESLHQKDPIDLIISDQRYGCFLDEVTSVFITHQVSLKARKALTTTMANKLHHLWMSRFDEIWVPDAPEEPGLAGKLSHESIDIPHFFLGPISRFDQALEERAAYTYDWLCLLSGPEPARSQLEELCVRIAKSSSQQLVIVRGKVEDHSDQQLTDNLRVIGHLQASELKELMGETKALICRSGYSTLMDLAVLGKKAVLVPTPGQPEQLYLANLWKEQYHWPVIFQSELEEIPPTAILQSAQALPSGAGTQMAQTINQRLEKCFEV
jgi:hypothetical protein